MDPANELIERIVCAAQIPSGRRKREIERELRAHIEDYVLIASEAGRSEADIERMVLAAFGDPHEIARLFAWVYRRERAILRISVFLLSTLAGGGLISAVALALQTSWAIGSGVPIPRAVGGRHLTFELLYIFSTATAYMGLVSLEQLFERGRLKKAVFLLALLFTVVGAAFAAFNAHPESLAIGFASGVSLRAIQVFIKPRRARIGAAIGFFALFGIASACGQSGLTTNAIGAITVWSAIGICCHLMTHLAARVDRALLNGLQQQ